MNQMNFKRNLSSIDASHFTLARFMVTAALLMPLVLILNGSALAQTGYSISDLDSHSEYMSLVLDADGYPVVSYYGNNSASSNVNGDLKLLHCNDPNCIGGDESIQSVDTVGQVGLFSALVLDSNGYPVVSYYDATNGDLKLLHCNDANCAGSDESITAPDTVGDVGSSTSLALDGNGYPVISYYDATNGDLKLLHCNDANCAGSDESITAPDTVGNVGLEPSLMLDANGYPVISYADATNGDLKLLHCNDVNCVGGDESIAAPDTAGVIGFFSSLVLDSNGYPVISHFDGPNGDLRVVRCNDVNCAGSDESVTAVDAAGDTGRFSALALDSNSYPIISYMGEDSGVGQSLKMLHCNDANCTGGDESVRVLDADGAYTSMTLDSNGYPVVSYRGRGNLSLLHCTNIDCAPSQKGTITVNSLADTVRAGDGECTLREAINNVREGVDTTGGDCVAEVGDTDIINLPAGTITLTGPADDDQNRSGDLDINKRVIINGDPGGSTISGGSDGTTVTDRVFDISGGANVTLNSITVSNGHANGNGGGIRNVNSNLTLNNSTVAGNSTSADNSPGGGIFSRAGLGGATVTLNNSAVLDNATLGNNSAGGGIYNFGGSQGSATMTLRDSTVAGNTTAGNNSTGGGIYNSNANKGVSATTLTNSTVSGNTTTGDDSAGGGIFNSNHAKGGSEMTLRHSTVTGNAATGNNSTGGGIFSLHGPSTFRGAGVTLVRSLVTDNAAASMGQEIHHGGASVVTADASNLFGHSGANNATAFFGFVPGVTDINATRDGTNTALNNILDTSLADNGGPTLTHALVAGSPAIDAAGNSGLETDQRGVTRPQGRADDIGAVESQVVNHALELTRLRTSYNRTPVENAPAGVFTIAADFTNTSGETVRNIFFQVVTLTNGNVLLNADGDPGGEGAGMTVDLGTDGTLAPGESFTTDFQIGLASRRTFDFFVDAHGMMVGDISAATITATQDSIRVHAGPLGVEDAMPEEVFLPLISGQ